MAGKPQNRRELRKQYDAAEPLDPMEDEADDVSDDGDDEDAAERKPKKKPKAPSKAKPKVTKAAKPAARMRIVWIVVNDAFKQIATFEYSHRDQAEARAKELTEKGKGVHFVQRSKEPMPDDAPGLGAAIPRPIVETKTAIVKEAVAIEDEEDNEDDDESDGEVEEDDDDE